MEPHYHAIDYLSITVPSYNTHTSDFPKWSFPIYWPIYAQHPIKRDIGKQCWPRSDAVERGVWSGSTLFALNIGISIKHDKKKNWPDTQFIGNGPVQRVEVQESTWHKWVNLLTTAPSPQQSVLSIPKDGCYRRLYCIWKTATTQFTLSIQTPQLLTIFVLKFGEASRKHAYIILTPFKPHFYIAKLGLTGVNIIFLITTQKHRLCLTSTHSFFFLFFFWAEIWKISEFFYMKIFIFRW